MLTNILLRTSTFSRLTPILSLPCRLGRLCTVPKRSYFPGPYCNMAIMEDVDMERFQLDAQTKIKKYRQRKAMEHRELLRCNPPLPHQCPAEWTKRKSIVVPAPPFRSMWEYPGKMRKQPYCNNLLPRFDEIYYKPSDKRRPFQRTWGECPPVARKVKTVCCMDAIIPPEVQKRIRNPCPPKCSLDYRGMQQICDRVLAKKGCDKIHWPCCSDARCPPLCDTNRKLDTCKRMPTPYRCYSDRIHAVLKIRNECQRSGASLCDALVVK